MEANTQFKSVTNAATDLGVPAAWLSNEARAGRIPALRVGRRLMLDVTQVREALGERAESTVRDEV